jgi:hypothetical protein
LLHCFDQEAGFGPPFLTHPSQGEQIGSGKRDSDVNFSAVVIAASALAEAMLFPAQAARVEFINDERDDGVVRLR